MLISNQASNRTAIGGLNSDPCATPPPVSGLHEGLAIILQRLIQTNMMLDGTLQRIHGPRPVSAQQGKNPETPSIVVLASNVEQELSLLEKLSSDLCQFIG